MSDQRHLGEIPRLRLFNRAVRPFHLSLAIACACLAALQDVGVTPLARSDWGMVLELSAWAAAVLLFYGWWARSDRAAEVGLCFAAAVWSARAALVVLTGTATFGLVWLTALLSFAWAIGAAGAWALERAEHGWGFFDGGGRE